MLTFSLLDDFQKRLLFKNQSGQLINTRSVEQIVHFNYVTKEPFEQSVQFNDVISTVRTVFSV
jgi:hypothetical protein